MANWIYLLVLFGLIETVKTQDTFYFNFKPKSQDVVEGSDTKLSCDVSERRHIYFQWMQNNKPVQNTTRKFQEFSNLRILRVVRGEDEGGFKCVATNASTGASLETPEAYLNILWIEKQASVVLKRPKIESVKAGSDVILKCQISGNPEPSINWHHNNFRLFTRGKTKILDEGSRLRLSNVSLEDNGVYSCRAKNSAGLHESMNNFLLNIKRSGAAHLDEGRFTRYQLVIKKSPAMLHCPFENAVKVDWFYGFEKLTNTSKLKLYPNGSLYFSSVESTDEGSYRCEGLSRDAPGQSFTSDLKLSYMDDVKPDSFDPRLSRDYPIVVPVNHQRFVVKVFPPLGRPQPKYSWLDPNGRLVETYGRVHVESHNLVFEMPQEEDSGNYTFIANNTAAQSQMSVRIIMSIPPIISREPQQVQAEEDDDVLFSCRVSGTPYPVTKISWQKNGLPISQSNKYLVNEEEGKLRILSVTTSDVGSYGCVASTDGHSPRVSSSAWLRVKRKLKFSPRPKSRYELILGESATIPCRAVAVDPPEIHWHKMGRGARSSLPTNIVVKNGEMTFKKVHKEHAGKYICIAYSQRQGSINITVNIVVNEMPKFHIRPANKTVAFEGEPMMIHCVAHGNPRPYITWEKDGRVIATTRNIVLRQRKNTDERLKVFENGTLLLRKVLVEDNDRYTCVATNNAATIKTEFELRVTQPVEEELGMAKTVIIVVCSAGAYLALVIGLTAFCSYRLLVQRRNRKQLVNTKNSIRIGGGEEYKHNREQHELLMKDRDSGLQFRSDSDNRSHVSGMSSHPSHSSTSASGTNTAPHMSSQIVAARLRNPALDKFYFPRHDLQTLGIIGKGRFGDVFLAKARGILQMEAETLVVVKSLLIKGEGVTAEFNSELDMYSKLEHPNIVRLLGVCREKEPYFMITQYCDWGDLKQFLLASRTDNGRRAVTNRVPPLTSLQKLKMCQQVALGMEYLSSYKFIHRDLAARNILLTSRLELKVCNLSLCRDVYASEYFPVQSRNVLIPLRWLPPEVVKDSEYSYQTDIWSYGILMWEVFQLADLPYRLHTDEEIFKQTCAVPSPNASLPRLDFSEQCPSHIVDIVLKCCTPHPLSRPTFSDIVVTLGHLLTNGDCV